MLQIYSLCIFTSPSSRIFQKENVDLSLIQPCVKSTIDAISKYKYTDGPTSAEKQAFKSRIELVYVQAIIDKLNDRFPHVELIHTFSLFDPHALPCDEEDLTSYGQDKLDVLLSTIALISDGCPKSKFS